MSFINYEIKRRTTSEYTLLTPRTSLVFKVSMTLNSRLFIWLLVRLVKTTDKTIWSVLCGLTRVSHV